MCVVCVSLCVPYVALHSGAPPLTAYEPTEINATQVYLVGDPVQLPATVISTVAGDHNYEQSMFKRLMVRALCVVFVGAW